MIRESWAVPLNSFVAILNGYSNRVNSYQYYFLKLACNTDSWLASTSQLTPLTPLVLAGRIIGAVVTKSTLVAEETLTSSASFSSSSISSSSISLSTADSATGSSLAANALQVSGESLDPKYSKRF